MAILPCRLWCCIWWENKMSYISRCVIIVFFFSKPKSLFILFLCSSFNTCPLLVWFTNCLCLPVFLRPKHTFLPGQWRIHRAPSGCCCSWSEQDLRWQSSRSRSQHFLPRGPCHVTARPQRSWQNHHHVRVAWYFPLFDTVSSHLWTLWLSESRSWTV